ncbi:MAG: sortase [Bacilli bacterium]|nr:sortase [Bacilli bacterium]
MKKRNNKKKLTPTLVAAISALLIMIGGYFISFNYVQSKKVYAYDYVSTEFFAEKDEEGTPVVIKKEKEEEKPEYIQEYDDIITNDYIGYLIIPKINLTKGFVDRRSSENDVEKNIYIVDGSTYPDVEKGNFIIAAHSGPGWQAFFNDLYQLTTGDQIYVTYKGKKYTYQLTNIYKQEKTGKIAIYRNYEKSTLTLITCTNHDLTSQTVYISELINVEDE